MYRIAKKVVRQNAETKFNDQSDSSTVSYLGYLYQLTVNMTQGDSQSTRDGSRLKIVALKLKYEVLGGALASDFRQNIRILVVRGHAESTTPLTVNDVIEYDGTGNSTLTLHIQQQQKILNHIRQNTHSSSRMVSNRGCINSPWLSTFLYSKKTFKLNIRTEYNGATTQIMDGGLYVMAISEDLAGSNNPVFRYLARTYFTDG